MDRGCRAGPGKSFRREEECREFVPVGPAGLAPPRGIGLDFEHLADHLVGVGGTAGEREDALGRWQAPFPILVDRCIEYGCIAFTRSGRFLTALIGTEKWVRESPSPGGDEEQVFVLKDAPPPWHHVDINLHLSESFGGPNSECLRSIEIDVEIFWDISRHSNLYLCFLGGETSRGHFYLGFQTNVGAPASDGCAGPRLKPDFGHDVGGDSVPEIETWPQCVGRGEVSGDYGAIFSRFGTANMGDVAIPDYNKCFAEAADYEGDFSSVRRHLDCCRKGKYSLRIIVEEQGRIAERPGSWVRFEIESQDQQNASPQVIGWLFFPGSNPFRLSTPWLYNFTEIYGEPVPSNFDHYSPGCKFEVSNLRVNGISVQPKTSVEYWRQVPLLASCWRRSGESESEPKGPEPSKISHWHVLTEFACALRPDQPLQYGTYELWR